MWQGELSMHEPWQQVDGETDKAYGAFRTYLNLGVGNRAFTAVAEILGKPRTYESTVREWALKHQWRGRCQAFDTAQFEKEQEETEQARLDVYAKGLTFGLYFLEHVGDDLKCQCEGVQINPETGAEEPYEPRNKLTVDQKIKLMRLGYDLAAKNAIEKRLVLLELRPKMLEDNAWTEAMHEILREDPQMHDLYIELITEAFKRVKGQTETGRTSP